MNKWEQLRRLIPRGNTLAALLYVVFFAALLVQAIAGVGQYWDWTFPYYSDQVSNFFWRASQSWTEMAQGSPLGYSSDYFVRWVISLFGWMQSEWLLYLLLVGIFTAGGFGVYLLGKHYTKPWIAFLLGVAAFVNPTIFYKFTAGHIDYLISYVLLIYLVHFLLHRFRADWRSAVVVALFMAVIGAQIQFLAIGALLVLLFFVFRPELWRWKFLAPLLLVPLLANAVWLSNFVFGGADLASVSGEATKGTFRAASNSDYLNIFSFNFSKATLISRFYGVYELLLYGMLFVLMLVALLRGRRKQVEDVWLLAFLLLILFLATGLFQLINLGPLTTLYPMFREVGHFAPVIVLVMIILLGRLMPRGIMKAMLVVWLVLIIGVSFIHYQTDAQTISFAAAREKFNEFKQFDDEHKDPGGRVLAYPFFGQYSFMSFPQQFQSKLPLRNSGHDSFSTYSHQQFIKNAVKPQDFKLSMQYRLLATLNVDSLKPYNIRYIYDFSDIYESFYDRYVSPSTFDGNLAWIKNNQQFMDQLLAANPGKVKRVSEHILEITNYTPRITATDKLYAVDSMRDGESARNFMSLTFPEQNYDYVDRTVSKVPERTGSLSPLMANAQPSLIDTAGKSLTQTVNLDANQSNKLYASSAPSTVGYQAENGTVTFFAVATGKLYANGQLVQNNQQEKPRIISQIKMAADKEYFVGLGGEIKPLKRDGAEVIGRLSSGTVLALYAGASKNLVANSSFESGLWSASVGDCNNFDDRPDIAMKHSGETASDGKKSLELQARRHDACTSTGFDLKGNSLYLLNYDYQSPNTDTASFYLRFNNSDQDAVKRFQTISGDDWQTASYPIMTPENATTGQLLLHAQGTEQEQPTINRYDNVRLTELVQVGEFDLPLSQTAYNQHDLAQSGNVTFHYVDKTYEYANAIVNGSFEQGAWRDKVMDCNNYDKSPKIAMGINQKDKTDGNQSLQLEATRHSACTHTNVNVQPGTEYVLSFDYKSDGVGQIGYNAQFDGIEAVSQERLTPEDNKWHTYTTKIRTPLSTSLRLYLQAYESNGSSKNTVLFDNVKLTAIPSIEEQFFVVGESRTAMLKPQKIEFSNDSETRRSIKVTGATEPFIVQLSESFHPSWRLELKDAQAATWQPGVSVSAVGEHFKSSGYANAWLVHPAKICADDKVGCIRTADGSYTIDLLAEFVPQRWFEVNRGLSIATLVLVGGYVALTHSRAKRQYDSEGIYRHPLAHRRRKK